MTTIPWLTILGVIPLIGALLALILGHLSIVDDETNGTGRLVFSRQITRPDCGWASRLAMSWRLSCIFLPLPTASRHFARPCLK